MNKNRLPLELEDEAVYDELMPAPHILYMIEKKDNETWTLFKKGKIASDEYGTSQEVINSVYEEFRYNPNFRIVVYNSILQDFPENVLLNRLQPIPYRIACLKKAIEIAEKDGFQFVEKENYYFSNSTGLSLVEHTVNELKIPHFILVVLGQVYDVSFNNDTLNHPSSIDLLLAKLRLLKSEYEMKFFDLKHRIALNNKRSYKEVIASTWHKGIHPKKRLLYLLEFNNSRPYFIQFELSENSDEFNLIPQGYSTVFMPYSDGKSSVYLESGELKLYGKAVSTFGWQTELDEGDDIFDFDFYYMDFVSTLNYLSSYDTYLERQFKLKGNKNTIAEYCKQRFCQENPSIVPLIDAIYGDPHFYLEYIAAGKEIPKKGTLNLLEHRQQINNIWNVI